MSNAKSIVAERLAKGEITEEEYDRLILKLEDGQSSQSTNQESANPGSSSGAGVRSSSGGIKKSGGFLLLAIGISGIAFIFWSVSVGPQYGYSGVMSQQATYVVYFLAIVALFGLVKLAFGKE